MDQHTALVSRNEKAGKVKIEYYKNGERRIRLWEVYYDLTLETTFDKEGSILAQNASKFDSISLNNKIKDTMKEAMASNTQETPFTDIKLNKPCPKCGEYSLMRYVEAFASKGDLPVMPLYQCYMCSTKSYHLTNEYLEYLVSNNMMLFSEAEVAQMKSDRSAFMSELRGYIIRIFASKKIMNIE